MYVVNDYDERHIYGVFFTPLLAYTAVKTLFFEFDKDILEEILEDGANFPTYEEFIQHMDKYDSFDWCGIYVDKFKLNEIYRK